ncbi:MAG TPA: PhnD/SsuA/transferrin family substrate-binding protein [Candidatus Baltobacteraceae bacterium]
MQDAAIVTPENATMTLAPEKTWSVPQQLFASMPWYDLPEIREATDAFWTALRTKLAERGIEDLPQRLDRDVPYGVDWNSKCLFTQTCGYPIFTTARTQFHVLGIPCYTAPGCDGRLHRSFIVVRASSNARDIESLRGGTFAINEPDSNSGMNLPRRLFASYHRDGRFFEERVVSGSHAASIELVAAGQVDAAAVDCVTYALLQRYRPDAVAETRVIAETPASPAPPFATSARIDASIFRILRQTLTSVIHDPQGREICEPLMLGAVELADESAYAVVLEYEREAELIGYPALL